MKILHKYVLKEHFGPLVFAMTALTSLLLLQYIAKRFGELVGKGLPWSVISEFLVLSIPLTVALSLPMAVLVSTLYAFSRLASENEITAMRAGGVSLRNVLTPVLWAAAGVTLFMVGFNDQVLPRANHKLRTLQGDIAQKKPTFALREQVINEVSPGKLYLRAGRLSQVTNVMRDITIYDVGDYTRRRTIYADSGSMAMSPNHADLLLTLYSGTVQDVPTQSPDQLQRLYFRTQLIRVPGVGNEFQKTSNDTYKGEREMSVCEMQRNAEAARRQLVTARKDLKVKLALAKQRKVQLSKEVLNTPVNEPMDVGIGRAYCSLLEKTGVKELSAQTPAAKPATQPPVGRPKPILQQPEAKTLATQEPQQHDTVKARTDSIRASVEAEARRVERERTDSVAAAASVKPRAGSVSPVGNQRNLSPSVIPGALPVAQAAGRATAQTAASATQAPTAAAPGQTSSAVVTGPPQFVPPGVIPGQVEEARLRVMDALQSLNRYEVEIQKKFALAAACFIFVLLGAPIALRFPRGGVGLTIGVSLVVFGLYYVGLIAGESLARRGMVPPVVSMWIANVIFGVIALIMLAKMGKESGSSRGGDLREMLESVRHRLKRATAAPATTRSVTRTNIS